MAADRLIDSQKVTIEKPLNGDGYEMVFEVSIKTYASGRTRVILPAGFDVKAVVNGGNTPDLKIELMPAADDHSIRQLARMVKTAQLRKAG